MIENFPGRLLGIDHGEKVIGLATTDAMGIVTTPLQVIHRTSKKADFALINQIIEEEKIAAVIIGLPPRPHDFVGLSQSDIVRRWAKRLVYRLAVPAYFWDEGLSTQDAENRLRNLGKKLPDRVDAYAAAIILEGLLEALRDGRPFPPEIELDY